MRVPADGPVLKLRAIADLHVVMLACDFKKALKATDLGKPELAALLGYRARRV